MKSLLLDSLFFQDLDFNGYCKLDGGKKRHSREKLMIAILRHWELASVPFYYSLWQHHHRQQHPGKKKNEWTGERGQMRGEDDLSLRPADSRLPNPYHHLFSSWGSIQSFSLQIQISFFFFVQIHRPTATSRETCPRVYSDTVPRCPGWAPCSLESGVTFHTASQSSHAHRLWKNAASLFPICHNIDWSRFLFYFRFSEQFMKNIHVTTSENMCKFNLPESVTAHGIFILCVRGFFGVFFQVVFIFKSVHKLCPVGFLNALVIIIRYYNRASLHLFALRIR